MSKALSSLSVGDKIEVPVLSAYQSRFGAKIVFKVADKNHSGYPANSVTLIAEKIIKIMASDAKEPNNSDSNRKSYGNNRHIHSNLLQWLNSNATAGNWYSAKHSADQAPTTKSTHVTYNPYTLNLRRTAAVTKPLTRKCFLRPPPKWDLQTKTVSPKVHGWHCSATTLPASHIPRRNA